MSVAPVDFGAPVAAPRPAWFRGRRPHLADAPADEILAWAVATFGSDLTVACSMQDAVLVDLAVRADPGVEVLFLDTGFHFAETLETARRIQARYGLNLVTLRPDLDAARRTRPTAPSACCDARKVAPLERHLAEPGGLGDRAPAGRVAQPGRGRHARMGRRRGLVKINPIVAWSDDDSPATSPSTTSS